MEVPAPAGADGGKVAANVDGDVPGHAAGQDPLEVPLGQPVLALEEEGAGQFQAHPDQRGIGHQHLAEGGDRGVEQLTAPVAFRPARLLHRLHALAEQGGKVLGPGGRCKDSEHEQEST